MPAQSSHWEDIKKIKRELRIRQRKMFKGLILEAHKRVILRTPVDTGRARGNWFLTEGTPSDETRQGQDKSGNFALAEAKEFARTLTAEDVVYMVNNLPYISALEHGHSQQAPAGMVSITIAEVQSISREILRIVREAESQIADMEASHG